MGFCVRKLHSFYCLHLAKARHVFDCVEHVVLARASRRCFEPLERLAQAHHDALRRPCKNVSRELFVGIGSRVARRFDFGTRLFFDIDLRSTMGFESGLMCESNSAAFSLHLPTFAKSGFPGSRIAYD